MSDVIGRILEQPVTHGTVVTVGTFDGVHLGHRDVLARLIATAKSLQLPSLAVTFSPHPLEIVNPQYAPALLTTYEEKLELLSQSGLQYVAVVPFTPALAALEAEEFVRVLLERYRLKELLVGYDHGFGRGRLGDASVLVRLGEKYGFGVTVLTPVHSSDGRDISSSSIRRAISEGDLKSAELGLGRPYSVSGKVEGGDKRGRLLGFPTLNISLPAERKLLPPDGVYAVKVYTRGGPFAGMMNLGGRPTFGSSERRIEVHLFDAEGDWYGAPVRVDFVQWIRETRSFPDANALIEQLKSDEMASRRALIMPSV